MLQETFHARFDSVCEWQEAHQEAIHALSPSGNRQIASKVNNRYFDQLRPELLSRDELSALLVMTGSELATRYALQIED